MNALPTGEAVYEVLADLGVWSGRQDRRENLAFRLAGLIEERQIEILFLEAKDHHRAEVPENLVQVWLEEDRWKAVLDDRERRNVGTRARGVVDSPAPDSDPRGRYNAGRIQDERLALFCKTHPEIIGEDEQRRAFRDQDIRTHLRERGMARTCQAWSLTEREVLAAQSRWLEDQTRKTLPDDLKFADILPKEARHA